MRARGHKRRRNTAVQEKGRGGKRVTKRRVRGKKDNTALLVGSGAGAVVLLLLLVLFLSQEPSPPLEQQLTDNSSSERESVERDRENRRDLDHKNRSVEQEPPQKREKNPESREEAVPKEEKQTEEKRPEIQEKEEDPVDRAIPPQNEETEEKQQQPEDEGQKAIGLPPENRRSPGQKNGPEEQYAVMLQKAVEQGSPSQFLKLADWCKEKGMEERMKDVYRKLVEISPNNRRARRALGYVTKIRGSWVTREEAARLGYYEHEGQWLSAETLKKRGLVLHQGTWLTPKEAKEKGLVQVEDVWMSKEKAEELEEKKDEKDEKKAAKQKNGDNRPVVLNFQKIRIISPEFGSWSEFSGSASTGQAATEAQAFLSQGTQINGLLEAESQISVVLDAFSHDFRISFADGSSAAGDNILELIDSYRGLLRNVFSQIKIDKREKLRYRLGTMTQVNGVGKNKETNRWMRFSINFFRHSQATYAVSISYPQVKDSRETRYKVHLLLNNIFEIDE